jgi:hypothetical protein
LLNNGENASLIEDKLLFTFNEGISGDHPAHFSKCSNGQCFCGIVESGKENKKRQYFKLTS